MRVGIDATSWSNERGYGRYTRGLIQAVVRMGGGHEFILFVDGQTYKDWKMPEGARVVVVETREAPTQAARAEGRRSLGDLWRMTQAVREVEVEAFYFPSLYTYFPILNRTKVLLGIHDVIAEDYPRYIFPRWKGRMLWRLKSRLARGQADIIVSVSEYAKEGIQRVFEWTGEKVWVVGEAPDPAFQPIKEENRLAETLGKYGLKVGERYFACLGGLNPHKNLAMLLRVFAKMKNSGRYADLKLALIGPAESDKFTPGAKGAREAAKELGIEQAVIFTDFVPDEDAAVLLNGAQALVMPSLMEGFGLGAVEAAACGTPVVATKNSPLPQLLEEGGFFIDPQRPEELQAALELLLGDEGRRREMGKTAREQATKLTWERAAEQFLSLLDQIGAKE